MIAHPRRKDDLLTMEARQLNDWLTRWPAGDSQAREDLLRAAYPRMEALARTMLRSFPTVRRFNDTADIVQNAALRLLRSLRQLDPPPASTPDFFGLAAAEIRRELFDLARRLAADKRRGEQPPTRVSPVHKSSTRAMPPTISTGGPPSMKPSRTSPPTSARWSA
jgi:RNA polymerase sigma-70 factor (ECF subfamily)